MKFVIGWILLLLLLCIYSDPLCTRNTPKWDIVQSITIAKEFTSFARCIDKHFSSWPNCRVYVRAILKPLTNKERSPHAQNIVSFRVFGNPVIVVAVVVIFRSIQYKFRWVSWSHPFAGLFGVAHFSRYAFRCVQFFAFSPLAIFTFAAFANSMGRISENNAPKMDCAICFMSSCSVFFCRLLHSKGKKLVQCSPVRQRAMRNLQRKNESLMSDRDIIFLH